MNKDDSSNSVSVVIVSWNAREYLLRCLASLTKHASRYPLEVIVVDNCSSDGSVEAVRNQYPQVKLVRNSTNLGFARANNLGIRMSSSRYVCLMNSDAEALPDCITSLVDFCEAHPDVGMVGPRIRGGDGKLQRSCRGFPSVWNMFCRALALDRLFPKCSWFTGYLLWHWPQESLAPVDILTGCFWLARRSALDVVGLLDESFFIYGEDMDWCKRFWDCGWKLMFVPSAEAIHYGGASSSNAPVRFYVERHKADLQYWRKHKSRLAVGCYFLICCTEMLVRTLGYLAASCCSVRSHQTSLYKVKRSLACLRWWLFESFRPASRDA